MVRRPCPSLSIFIGYSNEVAILLMALIQTQRVGLPDMARSQCVSATVQRLLGHFEGYSCTRTCTSRGGKGTVSLKLSQHYQMFLHLVLHHPDTMIQP